MAVFGRALAFGAAASLVCPAAGMHGFLDTLIRGRSRDSEHSGHMGKTVLDAIRLASALGSSDSPGAGIPNSEKVFSKYDTDTVDDRLSGREANRLLRDLGFTSEEIQQMQGEMDADRDGYINKAEFSEYISMPPDQAEAPLVETVAQNPAPATAAAPAASDAASDGAQAQSPMSTSYMPWTQPAGVPQVAAPPMGRDLTAHELQNHAARTQDTLVDAVENAEVAEIKRSVFRSLFRLRTAQIKEYDTIARLETQAIDDYNDRHTYRAENPIQHLQDSEEPIENDKLATFHGGSAPEDS